MLMFGSAIQDNGIEQPEQPRSATLFLYQIGSGLM